MNCSSLSRRIRKTGAEGSKVTATTWTNNLIGT
jgi:hypothetical protein